MSHNNKQFDNGQDFNLSDKFKEDLKKLYGASIVIPPEIDKAILLKASRKLGQPRRHFHILRWVGPIAAAAAVIIFALLFVNQSVPADIDRNGRVDILDAFKLAKQIQTESQPNKKWDINGDGRVNQEDVDNIAMVAVSLNKGV